MRRVGSLLLCSVILWAVLAEVNHVLAPAQLYVFGGALYLTLAALTQPFAPGMTATLLAGAICDANTPVAFGTHVVLFASAHLVVFRLRERVPRNDTVSRVTVAVLANLALFLVFSVLQFIRVPLVASLWTRLLLDLVGSQLLLALIAPWFFALQARTLVLTRAERENFA